MQATNMTLQAQLALPSREWAESLSCEELLDYSRSIVAGRSALSDDDQFAVLREWLKRNPL